MTNKPPDAPDPADASQSNFLAMTCDSGDPSAFMRLVAAAFFLLTSLAIAAEDMQAYLRQTQSFIQQGLHKEALERTIWFHENALRLDRTIYTTRLTVAFDTWKRLSDFYPPARKALEGTRDRNEKRILANGGSRLLFHDLVAINRVLEEPDRTLMVFQNLDLDHPKRARQYWPLAKEVVMEERKLHLASPYIPDVMAEYRILKKNYERQLKISAKQANPHSEIQRAREQRFVTETRPLLEIAAIKNDAETCIRIQQDALKLIEDPGLEMILTRDLPMIPEALPPAEDPPMLDE